MQCIFPVGPLLIRSSSLPRQECSTTLFQRWRYGSLMNPRWYRATQAQLIMGSYRLQYPDGQEVPNSWNIEHLRHFHP
jgi:hypothetical protein